MENHHLERLWQARGSILYKKRDRVGYVEMKNLGDRNLWWQELEQLSWGGSRQVAESEWEVMEDKNMEAREKNALGKLCLERNESYSLRVKQTKWVKVTQSCLTLATPWTVARQGPLSMRFSRQDYWSGLPFPTPKAEKSSFRTGVWGNQSSQWAAIVHNELKQRDVFNRYIQAGSQL